MEAAQVAACHRAGSAASAPGAPAAAGDDFTRRATACVPNVHPQSSGARCTACTPWGHHVQLEEGALFERLWNEITPEDYDEPDADWVPAKPDLRIEGEIYTP